MSIDHLQTPMKYMGYEVEQIEQRALGNRAVMFTIRMPLSDVTWNPSEQLSMWRGHAVHGQEVSFEAQQLILVIEIPNDRLEEMRPRRAVPPAPAADHSAMPGYGQF